MLDTPMHVTCRQWIVDVLEDHLRLVALAMRQRAKLEGWLKFELAERIEREGFVPIQVEAAYGQSRSDIAFHRGPDRYDVELKTPNTNYRVPGILNMHRPITNNIASIVVDARKLEAISGQGIVSFVLFPIAPGDGQWKVYLARISQELGVPLSEDEYCTRVVVPLGDGNSCEVIVSCFPYPMRSPVGQNL